MADPRSVRSTVSLRPHEHRVTLKPRPRPRGPEPKQAPTSDDIELIQDADGIAVIGDPTTVDAFLTSAGLSGTELGLGRLGSQFKAAAGVLNAGSVAAAQSGKWLRLTDESAAAMKKFAMVKNSTTGNLHATLRATGVQFAKNLQFVPGAASTLVNPGALAIAAAAMLQMSVQDTIEEIRDYLAAIDARVDDVLRAQKDAAVADMIGIDLIIEEAIAVRDQVGHVSDVTWSKVQATGMAIARTQGYALRQLDSLAGKVEGASLREIVSTVKAVESDVREWLAVIARCVQLQDAITVMELDRVAASAPEELLEHRHGLIAAKEARLAAIHRATESLLDRMGTVADRANAKMLLSPFPPVPPCPRAST